AAHQCWSPPRTSRTITRHIASFRSLAAGESPHARPTIVSPRDREFASGFAVRGRGTCGRCAGVDDVAARRPDLDRRRGGFRDGSMKIPLHWPRMLGIVLLGAGAALSLKK